MISIATKKRIPFFFILIEVYNWDGKQSIKIIGGFINTSYIKGVVSAP
jgi:hypothetical protein